jgi:PAS domain S-box-containing protein
MCDKINKIKELGEKLTNQMEFVDKLIEALDTTKEGIAILDKDGKYVFLNTAHQEMFKYNEGEMLGKSWTILYNEKQIEYFAKNVFPVVAENGSWNGKDVAICKDGTLIKEIVYLTALPDGGLVCTCIKDE